MTTAAKVHERSIQEVFADCLRTQGFAVHREVPCRDHDSRGNNTNKIDIHAVPYQGYREPFSCIGVELKNFDLPTGKGSVEPVYQVAAYMRSFAYRVSANPRVTGTLLARPQVVLLAKADIMTRENLTETDFLLERFLWKVGGALLRTERTLDGLTRLCFKSNAAHPGTDHHILCHATSELLAILEASKGNARVPDERSERPAGEGSWSDL